MNNEDLDKVLAKLSASECATALAGLSEKERKALSPHALRWLKVSLGHNITDPTWNWWVSRSNQIAGFLGGSMNLPRGMQRLFEENEEAKKLAKGLPTCAVTKEAIEPARTAVFATCVLGEIKKHDGQPRDLDVCYAVLTARKPRWAEQWARHVLNDQPEVFWPVIRKLEREQVLFLENDTDYYCAMALGMATEKKIVESLRQDEALRAKVIPMWADDTACRVLMNIVPPKWKRKDWQWARLLATVGPDWRQALVELTDEQTMSRQQLLEQNMATLTRLALESSEAASKANLQNFTELHTALCTSAESETPLADRLAHLLYSRNTDTVGWALSRLMQLVKARTAGISLDSLLPAIESIFLVKGRENSAKAVELLAAIAVEFPDEKAAVALSAVAAFENESADVHKRALALVEKIGSGTEAVCEKLQDNLERIAVVHRQRAQEWLQKHSNSPGSPGAIAGSGTPTASNVRSLRPAAVESVPQAAAPLDVQEMLQACQAVEPKLRACSGIDSAAQAIQANEEDVPALDFDGTEYPRLNPDKKLEFVPDFDAMVFLFSKVASNADDEERSLEALARLGCERPSDFKQRTAPLDKSSMWTVSGRAVKIWLTGAVGGWAGEPQPIDRLLVKRAEAIGQKAHAAEKQIVLSIPTHSGGWIDPVVLVQRLIEKEQTLQPEGDKAPNLISLAGQHLANVTNNIFTELNLKMILPLTKQAADSLDQSLSLLRLAPERRQEALTMLKAAPGRATEFRNALRYALGDSAVEIGSTSALWISAARARAPFEDDPVIELRFPSLGPNGGRAARYRLLTEVEGVVNLQYSHLQDFKIIEQLPEPIGNQDLIEDTISCAMHIRKKINAWEQSMFINRAWASTMCPMLIESWFAQGADFIAHTMESGEYGMSAEFIEKMYDPDVPLQPMALLTLALAISAKTKPQFERAMECLIQAIEDGRLNSSKLAAAIETVRSINAKALKRPVDFVSLTRWAKAMKTAALTSPYHALVIRGAIELLLTGDPAEAPKDLHTLLEVLLEYAMQQQQPVIRQSARDYLSGIKTSGKTAKLVKQLLALKQGPDAVQIKNEALSYALEKRIDRALRWQSWLNSHHDELRPAMLCPPS